ncbi:MAG: rod shape-determining protein MreC [Bacteroidia bacterium]
MRNLVLLIWKNYFFFLFLLLETLCIYLIVQNNNFQRASFINSSNAVSANLMKISANVSDYFALQNTNEKLVKENAELRAHLIESFSVITDDKDSVKTQYQDPVKKTVYRQKYTYTSAKVVNNSTNMRNNFLTLDKGSKQGIKKNMAVITSTGVVGQVKEVSENFCTVMSLLHSETTISAILKKDGSFGPLQWDGADFAYATLSDIPTHVRLLKGDTVVTSPYSPTFPENVMIGTVDSYVKEPLKPFYSVKIKLSTDFKKLTYVYIVNNTLKEEQENLEKSSETENK